MRVGTLRLPCTTGNPVLLVHLTGLEEKSIKSILDTGNGSVVFLDSEGVVKEADVSAGYGESKMESCKTKTMVRAACVGTVFLG